MSAIKYKSTNAFVVKEVKALEYIHMDNEVERAVDITKHSSGNKKFSSYPNGGMKTIYKQMRPFIEIDNENIELGS